MKLQMVGEYLPVVYNIDFNFHFLNAKFTKEINNIYKNLYSKMLCPKLLVKNLEVIYFVLYLFFRIKILS